MKLAIVLSAILFFHPLSAQKSETNEFQLVEATIDSVHRSIQQGSLTSVGLITAYLQRIKELNLDTSRGAPVNAFVTINPSVVQDARELDEYYQKNGRLYGPLHGIPIVIKDNVDSYDTPSSSGSLSLLGSQPVQDAYLVRQLRKAGAIILGKASMDEFAEGFWGISSRSGRIGNPYNPKENAGGSSGGSAAAVSANFALIGIGTDNSGSIRVPAAFCGVYGLRPSTGLISQSGIFPRYNLDGIAGPLARTVKDLAITLTAIATPDPNDLKTVGMQRPKSYVEFLSKTGLKGKRIGIIRNVAGKNPFRDTTQKIEKIYNVFYEKLRSLEAELVNISLADFEIDRKRNSAGEIEDINAYLASFPSTRQSYKDICLSNRTHSFGGSQHYMEYAEKTSLKKSAEYADALKIFSKNRQYVLQLMEQQKIDALLMPICTTGVATNIADSINTWMLPVSSNSGLPSISLTIGYQGLPVGMELIGKFYGEGDLLCMAYAYEQVSEPRKIPILSNGQKNQKLIELQINELNNLFTLIGYRSYELIMKNNQEITPENFSKIVNDLLNSL